MKNIQLSGNIKIEDGKIRSIPDYFFLPNPTYCESDPFMTKSCIIAMNSDNEISWKVSWCGNSICEEVLRQSNLNLNQWIQLDNILKKLSDQIGEMKNINDLKSFTESQIEHWKTICEMISGQIQQ
jgi:hypothetical protein